MRWRFDETVASRLRRALKSFPPDEAGYTDNEQRGEEPPCQDMERKIEPRPIASRSFAVWCPVVFLLQVHNRQKNVGRIEYGLKGRIAGRKRLPISTQPSRKSFRE